MKVKSCGILLINELNEILVGHTTNQNFFDIPKGQLDNGESEVECAIRECYEETSILLNSQDLIDLGEYNYNKKKNLYLFTTRVIKNNYPLNSLSCSSYFESKETGESLLEVDYFKWLKLDNTEMKNNLSKSLYGLLSTLMVKNLLIKETNCKINKSIKI